MSEYHVPNAAFMAAAEVSAVDDDTIEAILDAAASVILSADRAEFAALLRRQKFESVNKPMSGEFRAGVDWALKAIASWSDARANELDAADGVR
ncbi:hypothetical protein [Kutzneria albida]|uniref:Uncharacterized protein n=1 Tax=Kutzneria albida DSM 43870 TaxID=1449976 RepID=W5WCI8_9PSEU|nr:hypothetical protein [Kutzneria albida]AHH98246.1 hypothetical protein KALB_4884 [Kutzneria albida DSM 43870]